MTKKIVIYCAIDSIQRLVVTEGGKSKFMGFKTCLRQHSHASGVSLAGPEGCIYPIFDDNIMQFGDNITVTFEIEEGGNR